MKRHIARALTIFGVGALSATAIAIGTTRPAEAQWTPRCYELARFQMGGGWDNWEYLDSQGRWHVIHQSRTSHLSRIAAVAAPRNAGKCN